MAPLFLEDAFLVEQLEETQSTESMSLSLRKNIDAVILSVSEESYPR